MITTVREARSGGGFVVVVSVASGPLDERETTDLIEAFAMQKSVQDTGKWPDGKDPLDGQKH